ncbi:TetR/AcrR family transcriptional regulator [Nocardia sp. NEAU-G5]|uniref:TetR/AcrR family transcriptional regulator n=1 Tax=Nocardia albiluteola TaxID=2842303 RepID=A0ABS6AYG9_9NOCA|nr:TetR/AcrR family transcriptional regulator [Nocardia albiluteola]MBU3063093.1 TetR/AcrR family transcriptional regulator [Nocardia albiluteola]
MTGQTALELLWGAQQRPRRGPKPSLSLERIVTEAIALADSEGLDSLSMQRLAERLGCTKMALYRYVPGKAELIALMLDEAMGNAPDLVAVAKNSTEEPWRAQMRAWTVTTFEWQRAHPWTLDVTLRSRLFGPNEIGWMEAALAALAPLAERGLTGPERLDALVLFSGHARSLAQAAIGGNTGDVEDEMARQLTETLASRAADFPHTLAAFTEPGPPEARDNALRFGIDRILDGLAALIATRRAATHRDN